MLTSFQANATHAAHARIPAIRPHGPSRAACRRSSTRTTASRPTRPTLSRNDRRSGGVHAGHQRRHRTDAGAGRHARHGRRSTARHLARGQPLSSEPERRRLACGARTGARSSGKTNTAAAYFFDTLKFGERWQVNAGVRLDHYKTDFSSLVVCGARGGPACGPSSRRVRSFRAWIRRISDNLKSTTRWACSTSRRRTAASTPTSPLSQEPPGGNTLALVQRGEQRGQPRPSIAQKARTDRDRHEMGPVRREAVADRARCTARRSRMN